MSHALRLALAASLGAALVTGCLHLEIDGDVATEIASGATACDPVVCDPLETDRAHPAALHEIGVPSAGVALNGIVYVPAGPGPHPVAILLHGYPGNERNGDLAHALRRAGWTVLFFHYRGTWGSPGTFSFSYALDDVASALAFARSELFAKQFRADPARTVLVGHSMGGFLALTTAAEHREVACAVSLAGANLGAMGAAAAADPKVRAQMEHVFGGWSGPVRLAPRYEPAAELIENAKRFDTTARAKALADRPLLLVAGGRDDVTPPTQHHEPLAAALGKAGAQQLSQQVFDADHAFSSQRIALAHLVVDWLADNCR